MSKIVQKTNLAEFFRERVQEVLGHQGIQASELVEFYLVNLLQEFRKTEKLFEQTGDKKNVKALAPLFVRALDGDVNTQIRCLKELGDTALYISGFFAESVKRKPVGIDYYIGMGGSAYQSLAQLLIRQKTFSELYTELASKFRALVDVLGEIAVAQDWMNNQDLVRLYERWLTTKDEQIRDLLTKAGIKN